MRVARSSQPTLIVLSQTLRQRFSVPEPRGSKPGSSGQRAATPVPKSGSGKADVDSPPALGSVPIGAAIFPARLISRVPRANYFECGPEDWLIEQSTLRDSSAGTVVIITSSGL